MAESKEFLFQNNGEISFDFCDEIIFKAKSPLQNGDLARATDCFGNMLFTAVNGKIRDSAFKRSGFICTPNCAFIVDEFVSKEKKEYSSFFEFPKTEDEIKLHIYNPHRLVFRRKNSALKLFNAVSFGDGCEDLPKLLFNGKNITAEEDTVIKGCQSSFEWKSENAYKKYIRIHSVAMEQEKNIPGWHVWKLEDGFLQLESPDKSVRLDIGLTEESIIIRQGSKEYSFERLK